MRRDLVAGSVILVAAMAISFAPLLGAGITNWDDEVYLRLASAPLSQLVTAPAFGNYHPLTMLSFAFEERAFGIHAAAPPTGCWFWSIDAPFFSPGQCRRAPFPRSFPVLVVFDTCRHV